MLPQRTTYFISVIVFVSLASAAVGAFLADHTLDRYAESLNNAGVRTDVTRVKPTVLPTAVDQVVARVVEAASPSSYTLVNSADRVHINGIVEEARVGRATALTSDGWFLIPAEVLQRHGVNVRLVTDTGIVPIESVVQDPATGFTFAKATVSDVRVSSFGASERLPEGAPVFVVSGTHVYPRVLVDNWATNQEAIQSSDVYVRHYRLDAPVDAAPGALVADGNGSVIGFLEESDRVRPLHHVTSGLNHVLQTGSIVRPTLGLRVIDLSRVVTESMSRQGLEIVSVARGSAAEIAKLKVKDVIVRVQGESVLDQTLDEWVLGAQVGDTLLLTIVRDGTEQEISVTL